MALAFKNLLKALPPSTAAFDANLAAGVFDPRITFTRASDATYVNSAGNVATATTDGPRTHYDPVTLECLGYLNEPQRTNLCLWSEDLSNAAWTKGQATISADAAVAPTGTTVADVIVENTAVGVFHYIAQSFTKAAAATTYTLSGYCSSANRDLVIYLQSSGAAGANVRVSPVSGTAASAATFGAGWSSPSATFTSVGGGRYRFTLTATSDSLTTLVAQFALYNAAFSYTGDGTSGVAVWGVQLEVASTASSYIPTTGTSATRAADNAQMTGAAFSSWFNSAQGCFVAEYAATALSGPGGVFAANDGTGNNRVDYRAGQDLAAITSGGVGLELLSLVDGASDNKVAVSYSATATVGSINGGAPVSGAGVGAVAATQFLIGDIDSGGYQPESLTVKRIRYFNTPKSGAECQSLTT